MYPSKGSGGYRQQSYGQIAGTGFLRGQSGMLGTNQEADLNAYITHPSQGAQYGRPYASVYGSAALNTTHQDSMVNPTKGLGIDDGCGGETTDWTLLPSDLVQSVADQLLVDVTDYIRFRAVCAMWRVSTSDPCRIRVPPQLPWLMLSFNEIETNNRSFYRLSDDKTVTFEHKFVANNRILGSADGWLVLINELAAMNLFDPLTEDLIHLPPLSTLPDIVSYDMENVGWEYAIQSINGDDFEDADDNAYVFVDSDTVRDLFVSKVVMSSSEHNPSDRLVMACVGSLDKLVFAKVGDETWMTIGSPSMFFSDILYYQGQFYAVDRSGVLMVCDLSPPAKVVQLTTGVYNGAAHWYLVELAGNLLVVARYSISSARWQKKFEVFKVEKLNTKPKFVKMRSLGGQTLFLGSSQSMSFSARDFPGWRGNNIYFTSGFFMLCHAQKPGEEHEVDSDDFHLESGHKGDDLGVFNLADGSIDSLPCYPDICDTQFVWPPPIWFAPTIRQENDCLRKFFSQPVT